MDPKIIFGKHFNLEKSSNFLSFSYGDVTAAFLMLLYDKDSIVFLEEGGGFIFICTTFKRNDIICSTYLGPGIYFQVCKKLFIINGHSLLRSKLFAVRVKISRIASCCWSILSLCK